MSTPFLHHRSSSQAPTEGERRIYPTFSQRFELPAKSLLPAVLRASSVESDSSHHSHSTSGSAADSVFERARFDGDARARSVSTAATSFRGSATPSPRQDKENRTKSTTKSKPRDNNKSKSTPSRRKLKSSLSTSTAPATKRHTRQKLIAQRKSIERDALRLAFSSGSIKAETVSPAVVAAIQEAAIRKAQKEGLLQKDPKLDGAKAKEQTQKEAADARAKQKVKSAVVWVDGELDLDMRRLIGAAAKVGGGK